MTDNFTEDVIINTILLHGGKCTSDQIDDFLYSSFELGDYLNLIFMLGKMELAGTLEATYSNIIKNKVYSIVEMGNNGP